MKRIKANFIGVDGTAGYSNSSSYNLIVSDMCGTNCTVTIAALGESFLGQITYQTFAEFLENWDNIKNL